MRAINQIDEPINLKVADVAEFLGIKPGWVYWKVFDGSLPFPYYRIGRHLRFCKSDLIEFKERARQDTAEHGAR